MPELLTMHQAIELLQSGKKVQRRLKGFHAWIEVKSIDEILASDLFADNKFEYKEFVPMVIVGEIRFPQAETTAPALGTKYYFVDFSKESVLVSDAVWQNSEEDNLRLRLRILHLCKENH